MNKRNGVHVHPHAVRLFTPYYYVQWQGAKIL